MKIEGGEKMKVRVSPKTEKEVKHMKRIWKKSSAYIANYLGLSEKTVKQIK